MDRREFMASGMTMVGAASLAAPAIAGNSSISREGYEAYINAFNARDMDGFTRFYAPDVEFNLGGQTVIQGRPAIVEWYENAWARLREHCSIRRIIMDSSGIAAELETEFVAIQDWPDFSVGPLRKGDRLLRLGFIHYDIHDGHFKRVATVLHKVLAAPAHWDER